MGEVVHEHVSILTFNVFTGSPCTIFGHEALANDVERLGRQLEEVKQISADIICLQELYDEKVFWAYQKFLFSEYDYYFVPARNWNSLFFFVAILFCVSLPLCALLSFLQINFFLSLLLSMIIMDLSSRYAGFTVLRGFLLGLPSFGEAIFWKRSRFSPHPTNGSNPVEFSSQAGDFLNLGRKRGFLVAPLQSLSSGKNILVVNSHANSGKDDNSRIAQTTQLCAEIDKIEPEYDAIICAGDFNAQPTMKSVCLVVENKFTDCWTSINPDSNGYTWDNNNCFVRTGIRKIPDERVDFIFVKGLVHVEDCRLIINKPPYVSDHFAILAQLRLL